MIYIIGGNGFVGSAITNVCNERKYDCKIVTRENASCFNGTSCDVLINANGNSKKFMSNKDPLWDFDASVRGVRASLCSIKAKKYVHLSSCDVYPDCSSPETTKEDCNLNVMEQSAYGFHKYLAEQCVMHSAEQWLIFRMGGFVGAGLKKNPIYDILNGGPLWLDSKSTLQFINVKEAAEIILDFALADEKKQIYNLCGNGLISLSEVIEAVEKPVEVKESAPLVCYNVNISKLLKKGQIINDTRSIVLKFVEEYKTATER